MLDNGDGTDDIELLSSKLDVATGVADALTNVSGFTAATTASHRRPWSSTPSRKRWHRHADHRDRKDAGSRWRRSTAPSTGQHSRATLGAVQSRFENAIANIQVPSENLSAARGRIMDADFAMETANLSRAQILQQAGTAMVAQANQLPQQVLQLLK